MSTKTETYTLEGGELRYNGSVKNVYRSPNIMLCNRDSELTKSQILEMFDLLDARIDVYALFEIVDLDRAKNPSYLLYEIFIL